jgi:hypothetical protein
MSHPEIPRVLQSATKEFSWRRRLGQTLLLVASACGSTVVGSLLATEPGLPVRTRIALGVLLLIGLSWTAFWIWALTGRRVLLAHQKLAAARLALACTTLFCLGFTSLWLLTGEASAAVAAVGGLGLMGAAGAIWFLARRRYQALKALEVDLSKEGRAS